ncbi:MAG: RidA family protein [Nitrospirota bacterium]|nr:RidA family protein [Nitrospirota bacterium]
MGVVAGRLSELGCVLPTAPLPLGAYLPVLESGELVFTSGMLPMIDGRVMFTGIVGGSGHDVTEGAEAARLCAMNAVAALAAHLGGLDGLDRVEQIVQVSGHVLSAPGFCDQPQVLNGASEWLFQVFGETGRHTRMALGAFALPRNATVELALVARLRRC